MKSKCLKFIVNKIFPSLKNMQNYCLSCKNTPIILVLYVIITNKVIRENSRYANYMADKSTFLKQNHNKKSGWSNVNPKLFIY